MQDVDIANNKPLTPIQVSPWRLLWIWTTIGAHSFGGGSATLYLIRRVAVEQHGWITDDEFNAILGHLPDCTGHQHSWARDPDRRTRCRRRGSSLALIGLLVPSAAITVALTAAYASIRQAPLVRAAIAGVIPATVGLGLLLGYTMVRPLLTAAKREGQGTRILAAAILLEAPWRPC